jgi:hypothetical protein
VCCYSAKRVFCIVCLCISFTDCANGWWQQPAEVDDKPWTFHAANLGPACANMITADVNGDGVADIISSSAHQFGIWWHQQLVHGDEENKEVKFIRHDLFPNLVSQTHALHFRDINGDGLQDVITGKRFWAHGPKGDPGSDQPALVYWFEAKKVEWFNDVHSPRHPPTVRYRHSVLGE